MQIYVFECNKCGSEFEESIYSPLQLLEIKCPYCSSDDVEVIDVASYCSPFG